VINNNRVTVELGDVKNSCFVAMPFHALFEAEYERVIRPAIEDAGLICVRGDEIYARQAIVDDIWQSIRQARLVVAELSGRNPNVMYEIGLAHAIGKAIVLITRNEDDVPFDLRALRYLFYDPNNPFWGQDLQAQLTEFVRRVVDTPELSVHLPAIAVETQPLRRPDGPVVRTPEGVFPDLSGAWSTSWLSVRRGRKHDAVLLIPSGHGNDFVASITVEFVRNSAKTAVQESMTGSIRGREVRLTGVSYTYVEQGGSESYSLDSFELRISDDHQSMQGHARLLHGIRELEFRKMTVAAATEATAKGVA
jgi:hypothetical protein